MANWFQEHPVFTIIGHTIVVATATWVVSSFVIDENKVNLFKAKAENAESMSAQFQSKISVLELELAKLKTENGRYLSWLVGEPKSFPALEKKISELEARLADSQAKAISGVIESNSPATRPDSLYEFSRDFTRGESFVDPKTKAIIGISSIAADNSAKGTLHLPGSKSVEVEGIRPGSTWTFEKNGVRYQLTMETVNWTNNSVKAFVSEIAD
ncbi:hypothetical protein [Pseudomonas sp. KCJK9009]|uniref:hypothetical protein n=1 Tax=Pseudomonas sp. KCJK9009 TaxID=3344561 RepID=UPI00390661F0